MPIRFCRKEYQKEERSYGARDPYSDAEPARYEVVVKEIHAAETDAKDNEPGDPHAARTLALLVVNHVVDCRLIVRINFHGCLFSHT